MEHVCCVSAELCTAVAPPVCFRAALAGPARPSFAIAQPVIASGIVVKQIATQRVDLSLLRSIAFTRGSGRSKQQASGVAQEGEVQLLSSVGPSFHANHTRPVAPFLFHRKRTQTFPFLRRTPHARTLCFPPRYVHTPRDSLPPRSPETSIDTSSSSSGGYGYDSYSESEADPAFPSPGLYSYGDSTSSSPAATSKRRGHRRRTSYYGGDSGGGIDTAITHLDDHAEQLWHDSPAIRAAAAAAAAEASPKSTGAASAAASSASASPGAGQEVRPQARGEDGSSSSRAASDGEAREEGQEKPGLPEARGSPAGVEEGGGRGGAFSDSIVSEDAAGDDAVAAALDADLEADPGLRTHTDLGDLELAAEKALDLLRDNGDVEEGGEIDDGSRGGGESEVEAEAEAGVAGDVDGDPDLLTQTDLEDVEPAAETAPGLSGVAAGGSDGEISDGRSVGGADSTTTVVGERGQEEASSQGDDTSEQGGASGAGVSASSRDMRPDAEGRGIPVRLSTSASTGSASTAAAVPMGGSGGGGGTRGHLTGPQQKPQHGKENQGRPSASSAAVTVGSTEDAAGGKDEAAPRTPEVELQPAGVPPAGGDVALPAGAGGGGGGGGGVVSRARHSTSFVAVAARSVSPAVCRIDMERLVGSRHDAAPFADVEMGQGSGLIFSSEEGLVLTNAHVVAGARKVGWKCVQQWRTFVVLESACGLARGSENYPGHARCWLASLDYYRAGRSAPLFFSIDPCHM